MRTQTGATGGAHIKVPSFIETTTMQGNKVIHQHDIAGLQLRRQGTNGGNRQHSTNAALLEGGHVCHMGDFVR